MTGGTRSAELSRSSPLGWPEEAPRGMVQEPWWRRQEFLKLQPARGPAPLVGHPNFFMLISEVQSRVAPVLHSPPAPWNGLINPPLQVPQKAPPLGAYLGFTGRARCGRRSCWSARGTRSPWAGFGAFSLFLLSALALSFPPGVGGALGPQVGGVGLRDLQDAAHGADGPHQLLGQGCRLRHGTPRLRAAL